MEPDKLRLEKEVAAFWVRVEYDQKLEDQHDTAGTRPPEFVDEVVRRHPLQRKRRALLETKVVR